MASQAHQLLSDDHHEVGNILTQLLTALDNKDLRATHSKLDLLWARLAVHIRAEHLHLFPAVIQRVTESTAPVEPAVSEVQSVVDSLRSDHDFFMRELARAIGVLRELPRSAGGIEIEDALKTVQNTVREIERRLTTHNELEENRIYRWAGTILTEAEQVDLAGRINRELENHPSRFSPQAWVNR